MCVCVFTRVLLSDLGQSVLFVHRAGGIHFTLHDLIQTQLLLKTTVDPVNTQQLSTICPASYDNSTNSDKVVLEGKFIQMTKIPIFSFTSVFSSTADRIKTVKILSTDQRHTLKSI